MAKTQGNSVRKRVSRSKALAAELGLEMSTSAGEQQRSVEAAEDAKFDSTFVSISLLSSPSPEKLSAGKNRIIIDLVSADAGATIGELMAATKWQAHTIRAAISRLRRKGARVGLSSDIAGRRAYRLESRED